MINHVGEKFNKLQVIAFHHMDKRYQQYYVFRCDCGNEKVIRYSHVKEGKIVSCGCYKPQEKLVKNLSGQKFGRLLVVKRIENNNYKCKCDCGNTVIVSANNLRNGNTQSCGCLHREKSSSNMKELRSGAYKDITGNRYGRLTALKFQYIKNGSAYWLCKCDCGNEKIVRLSYLTDGQTTSCGCKRKETACKNRNNIEGKTYNGNTAIKHVYGNYWIFRCRCGNEFKARANDVQTGHIQSCGCKNIFKEGSKVENEIKDWVNEMVEVEQHNRTLLDGKEIDLYIPSAKVGIEYNGSYYHSTKFKDKLDHQQKFLLAKEKGIHLISIFDVDWENNKDKIKAYLKSLILPQERIFARKCELRNLDKKIASDFIDKYHLQGKAQMGKIAYGLFYKNDLTSVMTFDKMRLAKTEDGHYELHRYCVKEGYTVIGGAEKLFKAFIEEYNPKYILSYSDNDFFGGEIYERLKFNNSGQCTPRYYWFLNGAEIRRERCQLKHLKYYYPELLQEAYDVNASNKEVYVMDKLGAFQVWRSGNTKWEWFNNE